MISLRRRTLLKYFGLTCAGVCGAPLSGPSLRISHPSMEFLTHPLARLYIGSASARFASTILISRDGSYIKKIYAADGRTVVGGLPHAEFNSDAAMARLFAAEVSVLARLSEKHPLIFPALRNVNPVERSLEMPYLGWDLAVRRARGERLSKRDIRAIWRVRDVLRDEGVDVLLKLGNLYRWGDRLLISGLNQAAVGTGRVDVSPSLLSALKTG